MSDHENRLDYRRLKQQVYRYSLRVAEDAWEAEDLTQEVLLKVHRAWATDRSRAVTNAYLYRIVCNTWRDKARTDRSRPRTAGVNAPARSGEDGGLIARELLESLAHRLSPRSMVIVLLMDVFDFTAKETAEFLSSSEGAVQVALGRARLRLRKLARQTGPDRLSPPEAPAGSGEDRIDLDTLVEAFRRRDPKGICGAYLGLASRRVQLSQVRWIQGKFAFGFEDPDGNRFMVTG
ncbi:hypothetical protein J19TS2_40690 [Cohnella xylanilytica]|uniref:RNA polymerase sigma factor n=1 Tax=Cohnella xylanilytica TaxID=557555 RepID=UPI001B0654E2|nr:RNA polymerase sigma factor [Cohnella xylanilytica]GIO14514.1 hypothetical protein J19TS2_40690 [Cohnella xylanilytica]